MRFTSLIFLALLLFVPVAQSYSETVVSAVIAQNDDAEEDITGPLAGDVRRTSSDLEIGNENLVEQWVGLRFQAISIPAGSTINSATIKFTAADTDVGNLVVPIVAEMSLDPEEFGDLTPLTGRTLTTVAVVWDIEPWFPGDFNERTTTPNLAPLVQQVVNQPGWSEAATSMVFLIQNEPLDTSERLAVSFDGNPADSAQLTIDYTPGADTLLGDVNLDGMVNLLDVAPFVDRISTNTFQLEADINQDEVVNLLDVAPFITILGG